MKIPDKILNRLVRKVLKYSKIILFLFLSQAYNSYGQNQGIAGAELTYQFKGGNNYEFTLIVYHDCLASLVLDITQSINYTSSCGLFGSFPVKATGFELVRLCKQGTTQCEGGNIRSLEKKIYVGTVTLPTPCVDYEFQWQGANRTSLTNTFIGSGPTAIYIEALLNTVDAPGNSSPQFNADQANFIFLNSQTVYNPAATDVDRDILSYSLIKPRKSTTVDLTYKTPFSENRPFFSSKPLNINTLTGDMTISPIVNTITGSIDTTNTVVKVTETRNGKVVGYVMRDMQMEVTRNTTVLPTLTGINGTNVFTFNKNICAGEAVTFDVSASSPSNNPLTLSLISNLSNASLYSVSQAKTVTGSFTWIPDGPGQYSVSIRVGDGNCPIEGFDIKSYVINVLDAPSISFNADRVNFVANCVGFNTNLIATVTGGLAPYTYTWASSQGVLPSTGNNIQVTQPNTYSCVITDANNCKTTDSVTFQSNLVAQYIVTSNSSCKDKGIEFTNISTNLDPNVSISGYSWNFGDTTAIVNTGPSVSVLTHTFSGITTYPVMLTARSSDGCVTTYTKNIKIYESPKIKIKIDYQCPEPKGIHIINFSYVKDSTDIPNIQYAWTSQPNGNIPPTTSTAASPILLTSVGPDSTKITLKASLNGCEQSFDTTIVIYKKPKITYLTSSFYPKCNTTNFPDTFLLVKAQAVGYATVLGGNLSYDWDNKTSIKDSIKFSVLSTAKTYTISVTDTLQCQRDSLVVVGDSLQPSFNEIIYSCNQGDTIVLLNNSITRGAPILSTWDFRNTIIKTFTGFGPTTIQPSFTLADTVRRVKLTIQDKYLCTDTFSTLVVYNTFPDFTTFGYSKTKLCFEDPVDLTSPNGKYINWWVWEYGDGQSDTCYNYRTFTQSNAPNIIYSANGTLVYADTKYNVQHQYATAGMFPVKLTLSYNNGSVINNPIQYKQLSPGCNTSFGVNLQKYPALKYTIDTDNYNRCAGKPTTFTAVRDSLSLFTVPQSNFTWKFYKREYDNIHGGISTVLISSVVGTDTTTTTQTFIEHGSKYFGQNQYIASLTVEDTQGCYGTDTEDIENVSITGIVLGDIDVQCQNQTVQLFYDNLDGIGTGKAINKWYMGEQDTIIANDRVNFKFLPSKTSSHPITIQVFGKDSTDILGQKIFLGHNECSSIFHFTYVTRSAPKVSLSFNADKICAQDTATIMLGDTSFYGTPINLMRTFVSYTDGSPIDSISKGVIKHYFNTKTTGIFTVKFIAIDTSKCADTISKSLTVYKKPTARFTFRSQDPKDYPNVFANTPIVFKNTSVMDSSSSSLQSKWYWGTETHDSLILGNIRKDTSFNYLKPGVYYVKLVVANTPTCTDSTKMKIDLTASLGNINAFSPDGDDNNEYFFPPVNGIKEVELFRIYNRWGQVVHEYSGTLPYSTKIDPATNAEIFVVADDPKVKWDGKYNGVPQPVGSYVYYLKVKSGRDEELPRSGNLTLIR